LCGRQLVADALVDATPVAAVLKLFP